MPYPSLGKKTVLKRCLEYELKKTTILLKISFRIEHQSLIVCLSFLVSIFSVLYPEPFMLQQSKVLHVFIIYFIH